MPSSSFINPLMKFFIIILLLFSTLINAKSTGESTGFKLPRFVSTKFDKSNLRIGAGKDYPIKLTYIVKNFPLEIIEEHELWRKIIDINGNINTQDLIKEALKALKK